MFNFFTGKKEKVKQKNRELSDELEQLVEAAKNGNYEFSLNYNGLDSKEKLDVLMINNAIRYYGAATEYDIMKYKLTSDALGIALWDMDIVSSDILNPDNSFKWSQEFRYMLGFNDESDFPNVTHSWSDRLHPEDKERTLNAFAAHLNDHTGITPYNIEYRLMRKNGEYRYYHAFGNTLRDSKGVPLRVAGALMDINEKKEMHERLMLMLDTSPLCAQIWDKSYNTIDCNEAAVKLYGFKDKQEYIKKFLRHCSPEYQPDGQRSVEKIIRYVYQAFEEGYYRFDWMFKMPDDDTPIPAEVTFVRAKYENKDVLIGYTRDMREHHKLLQTINELTVDPLNLDTESFEVNLLKAMNTVGTAVDFDCVHIWKNNENSEEGSYTKIFEWSSDYKIEQNVTPIAAAPFYPDWHKKLSVNQCINGIVRKFPAAEREHLLTQKIISIVLIPVFLYNKFWGFVSFGDCRKERIISLSEEASLRTVSFIFANSFLRNEMTVKLMGATEEALAASRAKSTFLANMSHEIRTPMNAILGITDILMLQNDLSEDTEKGLDQIHSSCDLLLGIINDILDFSKIEAGKMDIMPSEYIVASLINDSVHLNMMRIDSKPIEFELQIDENLPAKLIGDALRIKQILNNLLSNAFKYTDSGKVTLSIFSEPDRDNIKLVFSVKDTGTGMTAEQLGKLFDEYSRFNLEVTTVEGTGLGLAITQNLILCMKGDIHVESEVGEGTLFVVRLPQKIVDNEVLGYELAENLKQFRKNFVPNMQRSQITRDPMPYGNVLIVDDVETNLYVAMGLLKPYMLQIDTVMRGRDAIGRLKSGKKYDIVFMDHMMPEMDGIETTKKIREWEIEQKNAGIEQPHVTVVALTANAVVGQADMFLQSGFDDFISKPIDIRQLNHILNKHIRDKQPQEVIEAAYKQVSEMAVNNNVITQPQIDTLLIESFIRDARKAVILLEDMFNKTGWTENEDDLRKFTITIHGMKSSLWNIGKTDYSEEALKLELAARNKNLELIISSLPEFSAGLKSLLKDVEQEHEADIAEKYSDGADTQETLDINEVFQNLKNLCEDYDRKGVLDFIAAIGKYSKETKTILDNIKEYIIHSEFDEALNAVEAFLSRGAK